MAHFAQLDENNVVIWGTFLDNSIVTDENGEEQESLGIQHILNTIPDAENYTWKQCSYNNNFRGRYPGIGSVYIESLDIFTDPKPYDSWIYDSENDAWIPPIPKPDVVVNDTQALIPVWDEDTTSWKNQIEEKPSGLDSWIFDPITSRWQAPLRYPDDGNNYVWNEENQTWVLE